MHIRVFFLIVSILLIPLTHYSQSQTSPDDPKTTENRDLISPHLLIPGLEQIKSKKILKGALFLGTFTGSIVGALINNSKGYDYYNQYQQSSRIDEIISSRENSETSFKRRNLFLLGAFSIWVFHLLDLKIFKNRSKIDSEIRLHSDSFGLSISF